MKQGLESTVSHEMHWAVFALLLTLAVVTKCDDSALVGEERDDPISIDQEEDDDEVQDPPGVATGFAPPSPSSPFEDALERWKYKPPLVCSAIPDHLELSLKSVIATDYVQYERKLPCTATTCVPASFMSTVRECVRISLPDWRVRTGEFIYGAEMQDGVCVCRIAKYETLMSVVDEVKALREEINAMKDALASVAYLMDRNLGQRNIDKYMGHFISQKQPDCTAKRLYEALDAEREAERLEDEARRRREALAYWEAICAREEPPDNIVPQVFWYYCKGKVPHDGGWVTAEKLETLYAKEAKSGETESREEAIESGESEEDNKPEGPIHEL